jgi:hypothetical protein
VCGSHGIVGEHHAAYWIHHGAMPPYMSNVLTHAAHADGQIAAIRSLIEVDPRKPFSVKDTFELDAWERTWRGMQASADARSHAPIFRPELLQNPDFRFLIGNRDDAPVVTTPTFAGTPFTASGRR